MVAGFNKGDTAGGSGSILPISDVASYPSTGIANDCVTIYTPGREANRKVCGTDDSLNDVC